MIREKPVVIHSYLPNCKTNPQPPGFADFLRGSIALYQYSKKYDYDFYFDKDIHPLFKYLKPSPHIISNDSNMEVQEILPPQSYPDIDKIICDHFESGQSFSLITNAFYSRDQNGNLVNFGVIDSDCRAFFQNLLQPNFLLENKIFLVFDRYYNIDPSSNYKVIHLRLGDHFIFEKNIFNDNQLKELLKNKIYNVLMSDNCQCILITDCDTMGRILKDMYPTLAYWPSEKTHIGAFQKTNCDICDTLIDFFILSRAKEIISYSKYAVPSGFSTLTSIIFDIKQSNLMDY